MTKALRTGTLPTRPGTRNLGWKRRQDYFPIPKWAVQEDMAADYDYPDHEYDHSHWGED